MLSLFQLFFSDELMKEIKIETNRYANEKISIKIAANALPLRSIWHIRKDVDLLELKAFFRILVNMALYCKPY